LEENLRRLDVYDGPPAPLLLGRHLIEMGLKPGPQIGKIVERAYFLQLSGDITSLEEAKTAARTTAQEAGFSI
jgi:tRNA nucleotidyltransferase (CCA-adding enzyme)